MTCSTAYSYGDVYGEDYGDTEKITEKLKDAPGISIIFYTDTPRYIGKSPFGVVL